jgi:hypothetical protein
MKSSMALYTAQPMNSVSMYGVDRLLAATGVPVHGSRAVMAALGVLTVVALYVFRRLKGQTLWTDLDFRQKYLLFSFLLCASFIFAPVHDYDLALLMPVFLVPTLGDSLGILTLSLLLVVWRPGLVSVLTKPLGVPHPSDQMLAILVTAIVVAIMAVCGIALYQPRDGGEKGLKGKVGRDGTRHH